MRSLWKVNSAQLVVPSVLSALAIAIPFVFRGTPLQIYIPPIQYSATAASHVPSIIALAIGPSASLLAEWPIVHRIRYLPITAKSMKPLGIVSLRDLVAATQLKSIHLV